MPRSPPVRPRLTPPAPRLVETEILAGFVSRTAVLHEDCAALEPLGILDTGLTRAGRPWQLLRLTPAFGMVMITLSGRGEVLVEGDWQTIGPEQAYLMPPGVIHGYRAAGQGTWDYVWVRFTSIARWAGLFEPHPARAGLFPAASYSVANAVRGLVLETQRGRDAQLTALWVELLQASLQRLAGTPTHDPRLAALWSHVTDRLNETWDVERLATKAHMSTEHLRRLCQRDYGCSPSQRLRALRLRRACESLRLTGATLQAIAESVGFSDAFTFSQTFKREMGLPPSAYRPQSRRGA